MMLDFKTESIAFAREHGCPPAFIIEAAMRRGAQLALENTIALLSAEKHRRRRLNETGMKDGEQNGD